MRNRIEHQNWILAPVDENDISNLAIRFSGHTELDHYFLNECLDFEKEREVRLFIKIDTALTILIFLRKFCQSTK